MRRIILLMTLIAPLLGGMAEAGLQSPEAQFDAANRLYEGGKFSEAVTAYESMTKAGSASPALWFNLGNAYFKLGQNGRSITAYRRASELAPRDPDIRANLQLARNRVEGPTYQSTRVQHAFGRLSVNEWTAATAVGLWATFGLLAVMQLKPKARSALRAVSAVAAGATLVLTACAAIAGSNSGRSKTAVVVAKDAIVHNGPLDESQSAFSAHDGAEFRVLDRKDDWLQISDGSRRIGWIKQTDVSVL